MKTNLLTLAEVDTVCQETERVDEEIRGVKKDSLSTAQNSLSTLMSVEESSRNCLNSLKVQSEFVLKESLNSISSNLEQMSLAAQEAKQKSSHLHKLNRWFLLPTFTRLRNSKQRQRKHSLGDAIEMQTTSIGGNKPEKELFASQPQPIFLEPTASEEEKVEAELDSTILAISAGLGKLKAQTQIMGNEIEAQNRWIARNGDIGDLAGRYLDTAQKSLNRI
ncbi:MAG: hypothetical protein SGCHY_002316 [Lobulomycetales sp.]